MTPTRYFIARIGLAFGISRKQRRMAEAANEAHLLREAEQILGRRVWQRVESVEELGIEYWNLRRLTTEKEELRKKIDAAEAKLEAAHEERAEILGAKTESEESLEKERAEILEELEALAAKRDGVVSRAREVRRIYDGIKTKLEVLKSEHREDVETERASRERMKELREKFDGLKQERATIAAEISEKNHEIDGIDEKLEAERKAHREKAARAFSRIGESNQQISSLKAEIGLVETEMMQLYGEIGRHVSRNIKVNPNCREATREWTSMVEIMSALRRSINLNHRLADNR